MDKSILTIVQEELIPLAAEEMLEVYTELSENQYINEVYGIAIGNVILFIAASIAGIYISYSI